jgi:hypothetical protein
VDSGTHELNINIHDRDMEADDSSAIFDVFWNVPGVVN